jgi:LemA protein
MISLIVIALIIIAGIAFIVTIYNRLAKQKVLVGEGLSSVGTFLQQRNDVIPNMVEVVKGYAGHENNTLIEVTKWRNKSAAASTATEKVEAEAGLNKALVDFYSVTEQYPDLKANQNFLQLQQDLANIEEKINQSRRYYNGTVRQYNQSRVVFPQNIVAGMFGFNEAVFFKEESNAAQAPKVSFKTNNS